MQVMLVDMDLSKGLPAKMEAIQDEGSFIQKLDYQKIAFRFHRCKQTGHFKFYCPSISASFGTIDVARESKDLLAKEYMFPLPLDKSLTLDFVDKFTSHITLLLKFL